MAENQLCLSCGQRITVDATGGVAAHTRAHSPFACFASGLPAAENARPVNGGRRDEGRQRAPVAQEYKLPERVYVQAPPWLPEWGHAHVPSVALRASGAVGIYLPRHTDWDHQEKINAMVSGSLGATHDGNWGCWTVPSSHFLHLANQMLRRHDRIMVGRQYNPGERCNARCKNALGPFCTCSCRAKFHSRGRWMKDWETIDELDTRHGGQSWHWLIVSSAR